MKSFIPPNKSIKYIFYWFFHYLHIFKNRDYSALLVYEEKNLIASMLIVPAHFKWPFMKSDDLQFTYVLTAPMFRGKGIGEMMLRRAIREYQRNNREFWYVTDKNNYASIRLCSKAGFEFWSDARRHGILNVLKQI